MDGSLYPPKNITAVLKSSCQGEGNRNMAPQKIQLWRKGYFDVKAIEINQTQEEFAALHLPKGRA